jgi:hypothetical protein
VTPLVEFEVWDELAGIAKVLQIHCQRKTFIDETSQIALKHRVRMQMSHKKVED